MNIKDYITEGIFDTTVDDLSNAAVEDWLNKNGRGEFKVKLNKNGTLTIKGDITIKTNDPIVGMNIDKVDGTIAFKKCPGLVNFEGMFTTFGSIKKLIVVGCENFESFEGCAHEVDTLEISGCPKFKSLETLPKTPFKVTIMQCGKRFKKEQIKQHCSYARMILCSEEDRTNVITEAFKDPILARVWDEVLASTKGTQHGRTKKMQDFFPNDWKMNEITPDDREEYDVYKDKEKDWTRAAQKLLRGGNFEVSGTIVCYNSEEDKVKYICRRDFRGWETTKFEAPKKWSYYNPNNNDLESGIKEQSWTAGEIAEWFSKSELIRRGIDTLYMYRGDKVDTDEVTGKVKLHHNREDNRRGMVKLDEWSLKRLAEQKQKDYKAAAARIKTLKQTDEYKEIADKIEGIMNRVTKMTVKMVRDRAWASANRWDINKILDKYGQWPHREGFGKNERHVGGGFLYSVKEFAWLIITVAKGDASEWEIKSKDNVYKKINNAIADFDDDLKKVGC